VRFTLITATYNAQATLLRCLASVAAQQGVDVEHLVVDGGSVDGTVSLLVQQQAQGALKLVCCEPDQGVYDAWNKALNLITGDWVLFLGADDWLARPEALGEVAAAIQRLQAASTWQGWPFVAAMTLDPQGRRIGMTAESRAWRKPDHWIQRWRGSLPLPPHPSLLHCAELFRSGARFDSSYRICADQKLLWLHQCPQRVAWIPVPLTVHSPGGLSQSRQQALRHHQERSRLLRELGRPRPRWIEALLGLRARLRQLMPKLIPKLIETIP